MAYLRAKVVNLAPGLCDGLLANRNAKCKFCGERGNEREGGVRGKKG